MNPVRVFACEAQPIVLEGLARVLAGDSEFEYLGSTPGIADALDVVREKHPDVLLVDQSAGLKQIFQFVSDVKSTWPRCGNTRDAYSILYRQMTGQPQS